MNLLNKAGAFSVILISLAVTGCTATTTTTPAVTQTLHQRLAVHSSYGAQSDGSFPVPAVDTSKVDPRNLRQQVSYQTSHPPGTIVVDTKNRFVYLIQEDGKAKRLSRLPVGRGELLA